MCDKELQDYTETLDAIEATVRGLRLASCSLKLEPLMENKSGIHAIKSLANRSQGALYRLHHAYTLHLETQRDSI